MSEKLTIINSPEQFDCKKQHPKCKAICCGCIAFDKALWERNQNKVVREPVKVLSSSDDTQVFPITKDMICSFLREDFYCNIYDERPDVCREYGNESSLDMSCPYLKKDGTPRSRQHRRSIQRGADKKGKESEQLLAKLVSKSEV
jgi:Fe-S-cluster containining protein